MWFLAFFSTKQIICYNVLTFHQHVVLFHFSSEKSIISEQLFRSFYNIAPSKRPIRSTAIKNNTMDLSQSSSPAKRSASVAIEEDNENSQKRGKRGKTYKVEQRRTNCNYRLRYQIQNVQHKKHILTINNNFPDERTPVCKTKIFRMEEKIRKQKR